MLGKKLCLLSTDHNFGDLRVAKYLFSVSYERVRRYKKQFWKGLFRWQEREKQGKKEIHKNDFEKE